MKFWTPLWNGIVDSSLWDLPDYVVKVFLTMLAIKDMDMVVRITVYGLAKRSRKTEDQVMDALKILSSPDDKRLEKQPFEGRRVMAVEDGWLILNGQKYQEMVRVEQLKAKNRRAQANFRARKAGRPEPYPKEKTKARAPTPEEQQRIYEARGAAVEANKAAYQAGKEWQQAESVLEEPEIQEPEGTV